MTKRHFLSLLDLTPAELQKLILRGIELKAQHQCGENKDLFQGKVLGMIFEKSSTRTRVSFESAMLHGGGGAIFLSPNDTQLGRGEPVEDTARVLSGMVDIVMIRTFHQETLEKFAQYASIPLINGLTDNFHPCQLLADMQTYYEHRGSIQGKRVTWIGDGFNMCHSFINAARQYDFELRIACPDSHRPDANILAAAGDRIQVGNDPQWAASDSDLVVTDVWSSMGHEGQQDNRANIFAPFQVNNEVMRRAHKDALFMHCLPAHRGEEVTTEVIDGQQSVVWEEAGNRLHTQKALLEFLLNTV
ncbi:ornithine carbamoyltransferase [Candidatus Venteria ishoeyi]|uniref:Ornithine carbamoyltransferase n=1 Tax=Candidatus Venteria ishoeyi TaxID=1899563 RepID=A0A1H6FCU4_9GAMM|nr:ornithine carbamoyltransferase [Candidatus Venteria ishoeyi]SEH07221.1 Ornithine carbamoyltransferase [Candidatus Venteria ishoeyi]